MALRGADIALRLQELCRQKKIETPYRLAVITRVPENTCRRMMQGELLTGATAPSVIRNLRRIAVALGKKADYFETDSPFLINEKKPPTKLGQMLRGARRRKGWSMLALARASGVPKYTIMRAETRPDYAPMTESLESLAAALDLDMEAVNALVEEMVAERERAAALKEER